MDLSLTAEQEALVARAAELGRRFATRARAYDEAAAFPAEDFAELREAGLLALTVPQEYGGLGLWSGDRYLAFYLVLEAIARGASSTAQLLQVHSHAVGIIAGNADEEQRRRILPQIAREGRLVTSSGSEAAVQRIGPGTIESVLRPVEGGFLLTGRKAFASLAAAADYYLLYVFWPGTTTLAEGYTTVLVPKGTPGVTLEDDWDTMGMRPTVSWSIHLNDVFIPREWVIGAPAAWVQRDPRTFTLGYVANHLGTAQGVFDFLLDFLGQREYLRQDQIVQCTIGEMDAALNATRTALYYAAWLWEQGRHDEAELASLRALHTSKQTVMMITTRAFDVAGARSIYRVYPLDLALRDARAFSLHFRESQVLQMLARADFGEPFHSKQKYGPKLAPGAPVEPPATPQTV